MDMDMEYNFGKGRRMTEPIMRNECKKKEPKKQYLGPILQNNGKMEKSLAQHKQIERKWIF